MQERYKINLLDVGIPLFMLTSLVFLSGGVFEFYTACRANTTLLFFGGFYLFLSSAVYLIRRI